MSAEALILKNDCALEAFLMIIMNRINNISQILICPRWWGESTKTSWVQFTYFWVVLQYKVQQDNRVLLRLSVPWWSCTGVCLEHLASDGQESHLMPGKIEINWERKTGQDEAKHVNTVLFIDLVVLINVTYLEYSLEVWNLVGSHILHHRTWLRYDFSWGGKDYGGGFSGYVCPQALNTFT